MTVTAEESITALPALRPGDLVRVSEDALDGSGYSSGNVRGKVAKLDFLDDYSGWFVRPSDNGSAAYVLARYLTRVTEADVLREQVESLTAKLATAVDRGATALESLDSFRLKVRETAEGAAEDNSDLYEPLSGLLEALGLDPLEQDFDVQVSFRGSYTVSIRAASEDAAREDVSARTIVDYIADNRDPYVIDDYETEVE
jgi:hypothetical protein